MPPIRVCLANPHHSPSVWQVAIDLQGEAGLVDIVYQKTARLGAGQQRQLKPMAQVYRQAGAPTRNAIDAAYGPFITAAGDVPNGPIEVFPTEQSHADTLATHMWGSLPLFAGRCWWLVIDSIWFVLGSFASRDWYARSAAEVLSCSAQTATVS